MTGAAVRATLALASPALHAAAGRLWQPDGLAERYPRYLHAMHGVLRASVPLMVLAAERSTGPLRDYLERHIVEETGHDDWLLEDLAALGLDPSRTRGARPSPTVARLAGAQYYWVEHHHPVALLGYIAVLESHAPPATLADRIVALTGVPEAAVRTVRAHAALDPGHADAVFDLLDDLPLTPDQAGTVTVSGLSTCQALLGLFDDLAREP